MRVETIERDKIVRDLMEATDGQFFYVEFIKKDGSLRKMNCRLKVKKYLKGGVKAYNDKEKNIITVFDTAKQQYRSISIDSIKKLSIAKESIIV